MTSLGIAGALAEALLFPKEKDPNAWIEEMILKVIVKTIGSFMFSTKK